MEQIPTSTDECQELKNIKYKSMMLHGAPIQETKSNNDIANLDIFLENEKNNNKNEPWSKLDKTAKIKKIITFAEIYKEEQKMDDEESKLLVAFLKDCLDRKRLSRVKDVTYDKTTGLIKDIPSLHFVKASKHFTLKNMDKRVSTLKSLPPKKTKTTIKNVASIVATTSPNEDDDSEEELVA